MTAACAPKGDAAPEAAQQPTTPASQVFHPPMAGETHLGNIRQLTFGGNNAEAYFSGDGTRLIFQRQDSVDSGCDQQYVMRIDGSDMRRVSNGLGRTTCGFFIERDQRIIYASTFAHDSACRIGRADQYGIQFQLLGCNPL